MPKSRRDRPVSLTVTKKHLRAHKSSMISTIHSCLDTYPRLFLFSVSNVRNSALKELRETLRSDSRFVQGKVSVMSIALGRSAESEYRHSLHRMTSLMHGPVGLLFTHRSVDSIQSLCSEYEEMNFARAGCIASDDFTLYAGCLDHEFISHPMEPQLRKLGLPTKLSNAKVELLKDVQVCKKGDILTPEQCSILQLFQQKQAKMTIQLIAVYEYDADNQTGQFTQLEQTETDEATKRALLMQDEEQSEEEDQVEEFRPQTFEVPTVAQAKAAAAK